MSSDSAGEILADSTTTALLDVPRLLVPGRVRGFLKRVAHGAKKVFKPGDSATASHAPSPQPRTPSGDPPLGLAPSREPDPGLLPQPSARSQTTSIASQPAPSPSRPTPTPSLLAGDNDESAKLKSSLSQAAKKAGADAWSGLKVALQLLKESSDVFPPLKSAVGGFLGVTAAQNRKDYAELALNLQGMVDEFKEHPGEHTSSRMSETLAAMTKGLEKEMKHVEEQQRRSGARRHVEAGQDVEDVQGCYRRVETLCRELQNKALVRIWRNQEEQQMVKGLKAALNAMYDSGLADVVGRRTCTPGTRKAILAGMRKWADDPKSPKVYWLNGMAGTGKTTLAYSFCAEMQLERRLGASFFCSRTDTDSRDVSKIIPTIAHQLARLLPSYREALIRQMDEDKEIRVRRTVTQFEKLIRDPLQEAMASVPEGIVVTIDAPDECDRRDGVQDILNVLFLHARGLPIKFLVTCRPEPGLFDALQSRDERYRSVLHLHDIEASFVQADITTFLEDELAPLSLPQKKLGQLAEQAATLFIYAATAVRYIHPRGQPVDSHRRLEDVLSMGFKTDTNKHSAINDLYTAVLSVPFASRLLNRGEKKNIRLVLDTAVCAKESMSVTTMTKLLGLDDEKDVVYALQHLRSVLHVSEGSGLISTFHASFPDFMLSRERSKKLCCDAAVHNQHLALRCFSTMERLLRFNICELESSFVLDENVPGLTEKIERAILPDLLYACRYWGAHLESTNALDDVDSALDDFLSNRLLLWMEVLNLKKNITAGAQMLTHAHGWLDRLGVANDTLELVLDASRFVAAYCLSPASRSTPHIYMSALPFWPETRPVSVRYRKRTQGLIRLEESGMEGRDMSCLATWDAAGIVQCVAFSPDGTRIVSGSRDNNIRIWDAHSGHLVAGPFEGHTNDVNSVAFSPDGARVVSCSSDTTIRVWDAHSGLLVAGPFVGHKDWVRSVSFSPDGTQIVSGSDDQTVRVWDASSGDLAAGPFQGHTGWVHSVAFSSDGTRIASGSKDKTVRVWDACSGNPVGEPFEGHTSEVSSVAFSSDGTRIVSGSADNTIRVWDARSGDLVAGPFKGHTSEVRSVAFSPEGTRIVSGSYDRTIRVWDARSGDLVAGPFEGHTSGVFSVAFSPDGTRIVSGSEDKSVRVWDASSGLLVSGQFEGHTHFVNSVAFSPNGAHIVSGSGDETIQVWDARSGDLVAGLFEGHTGWVFSVAFSPDGTRIVSGSGDNTICIWDARSGDLVAEPLEGHTSWVFSVAFSSDGTRIVSGSADNTVRVWDASRGDLVAGPFEWHTKPVRSVAFSPNDIHIVSGSDDSTICVWDARSGDLVADPFEGHTKAVRSVAFSPNDIHIASGSDDSTICVWDARSGDLVADPFEGHTKPVTSVAFSLDGTRIISGSNDNTVRVWDVCSGDLIYEPFEGHTVWVLSVAFSPGGSLVVSGSLDKSIRVWTVAPPSVHDPSHFKDWLMDRTGMVTTRQGQLLLCVPVDLWTRVVLPENTVLIYAKGVLELDFDDVLLGNTWVKCYRC